MQTCLIPIQHTTNVYVVFPDASPNFFRAIMPEGLGPAGFMQHFGMRGCRWERVPGEGWEFCYRKEGIGSVRSILTPAIDYVDVRTTYINESDQTQKGGELEGSHFCFEMRDAIDFFDPTMERTFLRVQGETRKVVESDRQQAFQGCMPIYWLENAPISAPPREFLEYGWGYSHDRPDSPLIATVSRDSSRTCGIFFRDAVRLLVNTKPPYHGCIHSEPAMPDLRPGESVTFQGRTYCVRGGYEALYERFTADLANLSREQSG